MPRTLADIFIRSLMDQEKFVRKEQLKDCVSWGGAVYWRSGCR